MSGINPTMVHTIKDELHRRRRMRNGRYYECED